MELFSDGSSSKTYSHSTILRAFRWSALHPSGRKCFRNGNYRLKIKRNDEYIKLANLFYFECALKFSAYDYWNLCVFDYKSVHVQCKFI